MKVIIVRVNDWPSWAILRPSAVHLEKKLNAIRYRITRQYADGFPACGVLRIHRSLASRRLSTGPSVPLDTELRISRSRQNTQNTAVFSLATNYVKNVFTCRTSLDQVSAGPSDFQWDLHCQCGSNKSTSNKGQEPLFSCVGTINLF